MASKPPREGRRQVRRRGRRVDGFQCPTSIVDGCQSPPLAHAGCRAATPEKNLLIAGLSSATEAWHAALTPKIDRLREQREVKRRGHPVERSRSRPAERFQSSSTEHIEKKAECSMKPPKSLVTAALCLIERLASAAVQGAPVAILTAIPPLLDLAAVYPASTLDEDLERKHLLDRVRRLHNDSALAEKVILGAVEENSELHVLKSESVLHECCLALYQRELKHELAKHVAPLLARAAQTPSPLTQRVIAETKIRAITSVMYTELGVTDPLPFQAGVAVRDLLPPLANYILERLSTCTAPSGPASDRSLYADALENCIDLLNAAKSPTYWLLQGPAFVAGTSIAAALSSVALAQASAQYKICNVPETHGELRAYLDFGDGKWYDTCKVLKNLHDERLTKFAMAMMRQEMVSHAAGLTTATATWEPVASACKCRSEQHLNALAVAVLPGSIELSAPDWARLEEGQHLNDAVLDVFIGLLVRSFGNQRVHAFRSHFFSQLVSRDAGDGLEGWENVRTWTKSARQKAAAGIFACDFLFLPIHHSRSIHWSLAVVCRPWAGATVAAATVTTQTTKRAGSPKVAVAFLNSLGRDERMEAEVVGFLQGYLIREWAESTGNGSSAEGSFFVQNCAATGDGGYGYDPSNIVSADVDVPQQGNDSDCGIFVLEFVRHLLLHAGALEALEKEVLRKAASQTEASSRISWKVPRAPRQRWRRAGAELQEAMSKRCSADDDFKSDGDDTAAVSGTWLNLLLEEDPSEEERVMEYSAPKESM